MAIKCGNKAHGEHTHDSVEAVKACYGKATLPGLAVKETAVATKAPVVSSKVPDSHYALPNLPGHANAVTFFMVKTGKGKWANFQFVTRLVGAPGAFREFPVKGDAKQIILSTIAQDTKAAAKIYSDEFSVCARCGSPLTDDTSRALGLGPDCRKAF